HTSESTIIDVEWAPNLLLSVGNKYYVDKHRERKNLDGLIQAYIQRRVGDNAVNQLEKSVHSKLEAIVARQIQFKLLTRKLYRPLLSEMPSLLDLQRTPVSDNITWEAVVVNKATDAKLLQRQSAKLTLEYVGQNIVPKFSIFVSNHMGGPIEDLDKMLHAWISAYPRWEQVSNSFGKGENNEQVRNKQGERDNPLEIAIGYDRGGGGGDDGRSSIGGEFNGGTGLPSNLSSAIPSISLPLSSPDSSLFSTRAERHSGRIMWADYTDLNAKYKIPRDLYPLLLSKEFVMSELLDDAIGVYHRVFDFSGVRIPFSSFLLALIKHYKVHFSQLGPLVLNKVVTFEVLCRSLQIEPTVTLFNSLQARSLVFFCQSSCFVSKSDIRGKAHSDVELTDEESSDSDNEDEVDELFRIDANVFDFETPMCRAVKEFNYRLRIDPDDNFENINRDHEEREYKKEHKDEERCELFDNPHQEALVCKIRRFEIIKYSFGEDKEYVAIKEHGYDDLTSTNEDACRAYQEIFHRMDEGISIPYWRKDCRLSESVNNHPNSVIALRRLRKLSDKIHSDVVPLPFSLKCLIIRGIFVRDKMSRDVITVGSKMRILLLYRGEYSQWRERFMNYLEEKTDGEAMINSIQNGDQPLPVIAQVSLAETAQNAPPTLKDPKLMRGSEYDEQDRKAVILYKYETFKANEGEQLLDTYLCYLQVINDLKKCGYKKDNCELNYKFLNNLQPEWKQYGDVNDALAYKKKAVVVTSDPLALVAEKMKVSKRKEKVVVSSDSEGSGVDDFSELKKITSLLAKAFNRRKFYSKPTNNNLRTSSTSQSTNKKQEFVKSNDKK
nr:probable serine/threonine-protein kinase SIS8 [Tanacetum cinerariifolium]